MSSNSNSNAPVVQRATPHSNPQFVQGALRPLSPLVVQRAPGPLSPQFGQRATRPLSPQFGQRATRPLSPLVVQRAPQPQNRPVVQGALQPPSPLAVQYARLPSNQLTTPNSRQGSQGQQPPRHQGAPPQRNTVHHLSGPQQQLRASIARALQEKAMAPSLPLHKTTPPPVRPRTEQLAGFKEQQNESNPHSNVGNRQSSNALAGSPNSTSTRCSAEAAPNEEDSALLDVIFEIDDGLCVLTQSNGKVLTKTAGLRMLRDAYPKRMQQIEQAKYLCRLERQNKGTAAAETDDLSFILLEDLDNLLSNEQYFKNDCGQLVACLTDTSSLHKAMKPKWAVRKPDQQQALVRMVASMNAFRMVYNIFLKYGVVFEQGRHVPDQQGEVYSFELWLWMNYNGFTRAIKRRFLSEKIAFEDARRSQMQSASGPNAAENVLMVEEEAASATESSTSGQWTGVQPDYDDDMQSLFGDHVGVQPAAAPTEEDDMQSLFGDHVGVQPAAAPTEDDDMQSLFGDHVGVQPAAAPTEDDDMQSLFGDHVGVQPAAAPTEDDDMQSLFGDHVGVQSAESQGHGYSHGGTGDESETSAHPLAALLLADSNLTSLLQFASSVGQNEALLTLLDSWVGAQGVAIPAQPQTQREPEPIRDTRVRLWLAHVVDKETIATRKAENLIPEIVIEVKEDMAQEFTEILHAQQVQYDGSDKQLCRLLKFINERSEKAEAMLNRLCVGTGIKAIDFLIMNACRTEASFVDYAYDLMTCAQGDDSRRSLIALNQFGDCLDYYRHQPELQTDQLHHRLEFVKSVMGGIMPALDCLWLPWAIKMMDYLKEVCMLRLDGLPQNLLFKGSLKFMTSTDIDNLS